VDQDVEQALRIFKFNIPEKRRLPVAVAASILLHILFLLLGQSRLVDLLPERILMPLEREQERRLVFEIVESNPDAESERPPDDARFASDRNSRARDLNLDSDAGADMAKSAGLDESKELPSRPQSAVTSMLDVPNREFKKFTKPEQEGVVAEEKQQEHTGEERQAEQAERSEKNAMPDNREMSAQEWGGFSLSTYAWDFAPYMLDLKRRVERNINPPSAFYMGMISGTYVIQFVIDRSGVLQDIRVLESRGNKALETTSFNAVKYSDPFRPLPNDFPDNALIVTGKFRFSNIRE